MNQKIKRYALSSAAGCLLLILPIFYSNCTQAGNSIQLREVITGNPMNPTQATTKILFALCSVLNRCQNQVAFDECLASVPQTSGMSTRLGVPAEGFTDFASLSDAESYGSIRANPDAERSCTTAINNLSCDDSNVKNAYISTAPNRFSNISLMVPTSSCSQVFTPSVHYACSSKVFLKGMNNDDLAPLNASTGSVYTISPELPSGLALNSNTGVISGAPTVDTPMTVYTVTATLNSKNTSTVIAIKTDDGFLVNDFTDTADSTIGDGMCATSGGTCTLRAALSEVNSGKSRGKNIVMHTGTILVSAPLTIQASVNIYGGCDANTIIDGQSSTNLFYVQAPNLSVAMQSLDLKNGIITGNGSGGGALSNGFNTGLSFSGSRLRFVNNIATSTTTGGGAVMWERSFTCVDCIFDSNQATGNHGGALLLGGAPNNIQRSLFINNFAASGGGAIFSDGGDAIINSTFYANKTSSAGGAIFLNGDGTSFINDTFVNNADPGPFGTGGITASGSYSATFTNTLLYNNTGVRGNCNINVISNGGNLSYPASASCVFNQPSDISAAPALGSLQNNGGFTDTLALLQGSAGLNQGVLTNCPTVDQRNFSRPVAGICDIGAYESQ